MRALSFRAWTRIPTSAKVVNMNDGSSPAPLSLSFDAALALCERTDLPVSQRNRFREAVEAWGTYDVDSWDLDVVAAKLARGDVDVVVDGHTYVALGREWVRCNAADAVLAAARYVAQSGGAQ